jgi:excisionase family DNA binding protein
MSSGWFSASAAGAARPPEVMDIHQCAAYLRMSIDTLYKYAIAGDIPAFKLGNRWRFKLSRIDAWMEAKSNGTE